MADKSGKKLYSESRTTWYDKDRDEVNRVSRYKRPTKTISVKERRYASDPGMRIGRKDITKIDEGKYWRDKPSPGSLTSGGRGYSERTVEKTNVKIPISGIKKRMIN